MAENIYIISNKPENECKMKHNKNHTLIIDIPKNVEIKRKNQNLIISGALGSTLLNLFKLDAMGQGAFKISEKHPQLLENNNKLSLNCMKTLCFSSNNKCFFKCISKIIKEKITGVSNGFLLSIRVIGVGYKIQIKNKQTVDSDKLNFQMRTAHKYIAPFKNQASTASAQSIQASELGTTVNSGSQKTIHDYLGTDTENTSIQKQSSTTMSENSANAAYNEKISQKQSIFKKNSASFSLKQKYLQNTRLKILPEAVFASQTQVLYFKIGFSHDFKYTIAPSVKIFLLEPTLICIYGVDKQQVTQVAAKIRDIKPPSVYKGKGIRLVHEIVSLKQGKRK